MKEKRDFFACVISFFQTLRHAPRPLFPSLRGKSCDAAHRNREDIKMVLWLLKAKTNSLFTSSHDISEQPPRGQFQSVNTALL